MSRSSSPELDKNAVMSICTKPQMPMDIGASLHILGI